MRSNRVIPSIKKGIDDKRHDKDVIKRFERLNVERLNRSYADMHQNQRQFLELLPVFFHVNHPILPGYVSRTTPAGIPRYSVSSASINTLKKFFRSFEYKKRAHRQYEILAIYLMGSSGSIAYSSESDFDIWLCYESNLKHQQLEDLQFKTRAIEEWAKEQGIEANIYLVDPVKFKRGEIGKLSSESSGSAQHYLLLEEFYRTSLLLAGRYPSWWLIPPEKEDQYDAMVESFQQKRFIHANEHIDFGGLSQMPAEEFYGASLWLLYKGIYSPYKSILKILLMQVYASEYPDIETLALRYKRAIYDDDIGINELDPYLMMLDKVEEFLIQQSEPDRLELVRRSFYFKVGIALSDVSKSVSRNKFWRVEVLSDRVNKWAWSGDKLALLDSRNEWDVSYVIREREVLIEEFSRSYQFLSDFSRESSNNNQVIRKSDLNVLGRKLYAAFERKAGKVDIIHYGIRNDLYEGHVSIHQCFTDDDTESWRVFSGDVDKSKMASCEPIKSSYDLLGLITWCFFNKLISLNTNIDLYTVKSDLSVREIRETIKTMGNIFPDTYLQNASFNDFNHPAKIAVVGTFINLGVDPFSVYTKAGEQVTSDRTDALRFGGMWENLALSIEQVVITTWQEVLTFRYFGVKGLMNCLRDYLQWSPPSKGQRPPGINAYSFSSSRGPSIALRIEEVFEQVISCFFSQPSNVAKQYVLGIEWDYYLLQIDEDNLKFCAAGTLERLIESLSVSQSTFYATEFDIETDKDSDLPIIYSVNKPGVVQCFYHVEGNLVKIYILDEKGSLCHHQEDYHDVYTLVMHMKQFFAAVYKRMRSLKVNQNLSDILEFYLVKHSDYGGTFLENYKFNRYLHPAKFTGLRVVCDKIEDEVVFAIYCENKEFTSQEYGEQLYFEVARHILKMRKSESRYPVYITDLDLKENLMDMSMEYLQTFHFLKYKKEIEHYLNVAIEALV
ncbi:class I adenylate cyclase [Beggiatoa alba]|nr:class I adenylate cyclase [Beggiatoa alba]